MWLFIAEKRRKVFHRNESMIVKHRPLSIRGTPEQREDARKMILQIRNRFRSSGLPEKHYQTVLAFLHNYRLKYGTVPTIEELVKVFPKLK